MPTYRIEAPNGNTYQIDGPEGASQEDVARAVLAQNPEAGVERTVFGHAKESLKAIPRGALGFLGQLATGAAALLPEEYEKPVVDKVQELTKRFSPQVAPGYEESVPVRLAEGLGSMVAPIVIPGGTFGRLAAFGAAGAGEARQNAQREGATPEQISTATAQGVAPGLTDMLPFHYLLGSVGKVAVGGLISRGVRMAATGGVEGATEAAQKIMQNAITQGYKPEQGLYDGAVEEGSYGAGVGAIAQGLLDLAFGRRAPRIQPPPARQEPAPVAPVDPSLGGAPAPEVAAPVVPEAAAPEVAPAPAPEVAPAPVTPEAAAPAPVDPAKLAATVAARGVTFKQFMATNPTVDEMLAWQAVVAQRLATGKEGMKIPALKKQQEVLAKSIAAAQAAPAPVEEEQEVVGAAPAIDPVTQLSQPKPEADNAPAPNAQPDAAVQPEPPAVADSNGVPVLQRPPAGGATVPVGGAGVAANIKPAGEAAAGAVKESGALNEDAGVGLRATVVKPTPEEAARQAAAAAEVERQMEATKKPKKSKLDALPDDSKPIEKSDNELSAEALDDPSLPLRTRLEHIAYLLGSPSGRVILKNKNVPTGHIAQGRAIKEKMEGKDLARVEKQENRKIYLESQRLDAEIDAAVRANKIAQTDGKSLDMARLDEEITDLKKERDALREKAKERGIDLKKARTAVLGENIRAPRASLSGEDTIRTDHTAKEVAEALRKEFGNSPGFDKLVTVHQTENDMLNAHPEMAEHPDWHPGIRGVAHNGRVHLVANKIHRGQELGVFLHEAGTHIGFDRLESEGKLDRKALADQVRKWAQTNDLKGKVAQYALAKGINDDEIIAYTVEGLVNRGVTPTGFRLESTWLRKIMAAFKTILDKMGIGRDVSPQELVDLAAGAAHLEIESAVVRDIATEVFAEPKTRFEEGMKPFWFSKMRNMDEKGVERHDVVPIGAYGPVKNAGIVFRNFKRGGASQFISVEVVDMDAPAGLLFLETHVDTFNASPLDSHREKPSWADTDIGTSGPLSADRESYVRKKYKDYLYHSNGYIKWKDGIVGNQTVRMGFRTLRHWMDKVGVLDGVQAVHFARGTGALSGQNKERSYPRSVFMRFSKKDKDAESSFEVVTNEKTGNVEIVADGKVVYAQSFAKPALLANFKDGALEYMVNERSRNVRNSDEFKTQLRKARADWMETQPLNNYELRLIAINKAASGYEFGDDVANMVMANSDGGTIENIRPSLSNSNLKYDAKAAGEGNNDTRGRSQAQIAKDILKAGKQWNLSGKPDMRFSQANPGLDAVDTKLWDLVSGPPARKTTLGRMVDSVANASPTGTKKFMQAVRQGFANKATWWEDWISALEGNNSRDAAGQASTLDKIAAASKVTGIQVATLEKGGFGKNKSNGLWNAVEYKDSIKKVEEIVQSMVGKYRVTPDFAGAEKAFNLAAIAKREEGLIASKQTEDTGGVIKRTLTDAQMKQGLDAYNSTPEIREALNTYKVVNDRMVDTLVSAGVVDAETAKGLKGNAGYVPWFRFSQNEDGSINTKQVKSFSKGLINTGDMKDLEGGSIDKTQINNVLDNMVGLSNWMVSKAVGNDTANYMVDYAVAHGEAKRVGQRGKNTVTVLRDGVETFFQFKDAAALPAFRGYEAAHSAIVETLAAPANLLRQGIVLNPMFSLAQLPQDSIRAFAAGGLKNPYAIFPRVLKNFTTELFGRSATAEELAKYGIVGKGSDIMPGKRNLRRKMGYYEPGAKGAWDKFVDGLERISAASDEAVRTALYELTMEEGGGQVLALRRAREIINFDTQGANDTSSFLRQTVPFMGVWMNDMNNLYKGLVLGSARLSEGERAQTRAAIVYRGTQLAALVMLYTLAVGDDDDYKKLPDDIRNRSLIIPGTGVRIPVPNDGIGFLFKIIPEEITRMVMAKGVDGEDAGGRMGRAIANGFFNMGSFENLLPGVGSPGLKVPVELILNRSFFTQNAIVGKSKENLLPSQQFTEGTSEIAKQLGESMGLSPIKIDYLIKGLTGQIGGAVLSTFNALFHAATGKVTPSISSIKDIPLVGQFGYSSQDKADLENYYELRDRVDAVSRTYKDLAMNPEAARAFLEDPLNRKALALRQLQTRIDLDLAKFREARKVILATPDIDANEMRRRVDALDEQQTKYLQSLRLPTFRAFAEISPSTGTGFSKILR